MSAVPKNEKRALLRVNMRLHTLGAQYIGRFPNFSRPKVIGFYSVDESRALQDNANNVSYLYMPPRSTMPLDLNAGIENVQRKASTPDFHDIHLLCQYIKKHPEHLIRCSDGKMKLPSEFVTFRGILRLIMCTLYEEHKDYRLMVTRLNGTIYMARVDTEADRNDREKMTQKQLDMCSWGFKFEQYCTTADPKKPPVTNTPVNEATEFACVYRSKLNGLNLLYGAEMDAIKSDKVINLNDRKQLESAQFVELKTTACRLNHHQKRIFDSTKSLNWFCQSYLVGISTILAGQRDQNGQILDIIEYNVFELHHHKPWSPAAVVAFLSSFLQEIISLMSQLGDDDIVQLDYSAKKDHVQYTVLDKTEPRPQILPLWYRQFMRGEKESPQPT